MEVGGGEVGPGHIAEVEFGIGQLPEQEVGQALFATGADDEVGVRDAVGVECGGHHFRGDDFSGSGAVLHQLGGGAEEFIPSAIIDRKHGGEAGVGGGFGFHFGHQLQDIGGEFGGRGAVANKADAQVFLHDFIEFVFEIAAHEGEEAADFFPWAFPVFGTEGVEGGVFHAQSCQFFAHAAHGFYALGVAL